MTDRKQFDNIKQMVNYLEDEYNITVMSIRDYGSRAWNLDSETSDMDAGMVYHQPLHKYVELGGYRQNIDRKFMLDGEEFELIGWNIKRFAELLNTSNPSMIEWLNSSIHYYNAWIPTGGGRIQIGADSDVLFEEIQEHANQNFKPVALWGHYREMGKANYNKYIDSGNDIRVKRHLYILRGLLYSRYVLDTHRRPLLDFPKFCDENLEDMDIPKYVKQYTREFIRKKKNGEGNTQIADEELWNWMENEIDRGDSIDHDKHDTRGIDKEKLNNWMHRMIPR